MQLRQNTRPSRGYMILLAMLLVAFLLPIISVTLSLFDPNWNEWLGLWRTTLPMYIFNTLTLMIMVGIISSLIGISCAWCVTAYDFPGRRWLSWALILPIATPAYIVAYVYADLLEYYGPVQSTLRLLFNWQNGDYVFPPIRNLAGASFVLSLVLYPYIYLLTRAAFLKQSQSQWWAARALGVPPRQAFYRIVLPSARPAIAGGLALVLMETLADFGVADFFALPTFSVGIFRNWLIVGDKSTALKLASLMLLAVFVLVIFEAGLRKGRVSDADHSKGSPHRMPLRGMKAAYMTIFCMLPLAFGLLIPVSRLIYHSVFMGDNMDVYHIGVFAKNSLILGVIVATLLIGAAMLLAYIKRQHDSRLTQRAIRLATLGYALPGALLAVGLLAPLSVLDQILTRFMTANLGWEGGLILTGTVVALIYALNVRFITVAYNSLEAGFSKISPSIEHAARSLNASWTRRVRTIILPLLRPSLMTAFILVFIDVMRELPATLIMRPFNFDTLATRVYWLASDERLAEASTAALVIIAIGVIPTFYLNRFINENKDQA